MALTPGTNCGFVTTAPSTDPGGASAQQGDDRTWGIKHTTPASINTVTEIGWWSSASEEANFEVAIYTDDGGGVGSHPENIVGISRTNAKGTGAGWKR
ncbi:hypothetical protein LCGC14_2901290, partial [marine sediment metagenome]